MLPKIKKYLRTETKEMVLAIIVFVAICVFFFLYLKYIGIPMSSAHNLFNQAVLELEQGDILEARSYLEKSLSVRESKEARDLLQVLEDQ
jgi:hypothetical protein